MTTAIAPSSLKELNSTSIYEQDAVTLQAGKDVRNRDLYREAKEQIQALRDLSIKTVKQGGALSGQAAQASLATLQAIWNFIMAIVRWFARVFNLKSSEKQTDTQVAALLPEDAVEANSKEILDTLAEAQSAPVDIASSFAKSLKYAGLAGMDASLLKFVQGADVFKNAKAPSEMFLAALTKAEVAMTAVGAQFFEANITRAAAANELDENFKPPVNVEDMVKIYRSNAFSPQSMNAEQVVKINALIAADDKLVAVSGHQSLIRETMLAITAAAVSAEVDVAQHPELLLSVLGHDWEVKLSAIQNEMTSKNVLDADKVPSNLAIDAAGPKAVGVVFRDLMTRLEKGANDTAPIDSTTDEVKTPVAQNATELAASFMASAVNSNTSLPMTASERLKLASGCSTQFPEQPDNLMSDDPFLAEPGPKS